MEEYYYWSGKKNWVPFPDELNNKILENYGVEPLPDYFALSSPPISNWSPPIRRLSPGCFFAKFAV